MKTDKCQHREGKRVCGRPRAEHCPSPGPWAVCSLLQHRFVKLKPAPPRKRAAKRAERRVIQFAKDAVKCRKNLGYLCRLHWEALADAVALLAARKKRRPASSPEAIGR